MDCLHYTKKGLMYERKTVITEAPASMEWEGNTITINGGGKVVLVGIVRGGCYENDNPVYRVTAPDVVQLTTEIIVKEWIYKLYVNGKRILDPEKYLHRKGVVL